MAKSSKNHKYQQISSDQREKIINEVNNKGNSIRKVATKFRMSHSTVQDIVKRFDEENRITLKQRGGDKRSILNEDHKNFLSECVEEEPWISIADLTQKLIHRYSNLKV